MMLIYVLQTTVPLVAILWLALWPPRDLAGVSMLGLSAALLTLLAAQQGIWIFPPWWVQYGTGILLVGVILYRLMRLRGKQWVPSGVFGWLCLGLLFVTTVLSGAQIRANLAAGEVPKGRSVELAWPLAPGIYLVANGGAAASINAHAALLDPAHPLHTGFGGSSYGVDLIAINTWGLRASSTMPADPARYRIFGTPVLAPCAGMVIQAVEDRPDRSVPEMDETHPEGNHVLMRCDGLDILLGHLRKGSVQVAAGQNLMPGQQIGEVGNSGESGEPHLHIHAQVPGTRDDQFSGAPVPILFQGRFLVRNDRVDIRANGVRATSMRK